MNITEHYLSPSGCAYRLVPTDLVISGYHTEMVMRLLPIGLCMGCVKWDLEPITWDAKRMEADHA